VVEDVMDIIQVFLNKVADLQVSWNGLIPTILSLVVCCGTLDTGVVYKGHGGVWDFRLKNKQDVTMEDHGCTCPSLW
jgi:hypothetical protein